MDRRDQQRPSAAELGVSEAVYERILRDLGHDPAPAAAGGAGGAGGSGPVRPSRRATVPVVGLVLLLLLCVALLSWPRADGTLPVSSGPGSHAFLREQDGAPVTYTSCRPIDVAVYPAGGPSDAEALVREAVATVRSATGLDLVVIGAFGGAAPNWDFGAAPVGRDDPISISWQDGDAIAELTDHVAGLGGSRVLTNPDGSERLVAGTIALSRDYYTLLEEQGRDAEARAVLLHELGHVLGLAHVEDPGELMYSDNIGRTAYGPGDLAGLRVLGKGRCF